MLVKNLGRESEALCSGGSRVEGQPVRANQEVVNVSKNSIPGLGRLRQCTRTSLPEASQNRRRYSFEQVVAFQYCQGVEESARIRDRRSRADSAQVITDHVRKNEADQGRRECPTCQASALNAGEV